MSLRQQLLLLQLDHLWAFQGPIEEVGLQEGMKGRPKQIRMLAMYRRLIDCLSWNQNQYNIIVALSICINIVAYLAQ